FRYDVIYIITRNEREKKDSKSRPSHYRVKQKEPELSDQFRFLQKCGGKGTRTPNPLLAKQMRYQLRHAPRGLIRLYLLLMPKCLELLYVLQQSYKLHLKQRSWQVLEELFSCLLLFWCSGRTKT